MNNHLIESQQLDRDILMRLFSRADELRKICKESSCPETLRGKVMATLFYEPSTRTRLSFESAMLRLGGRVMGTESASHFSSVVKGESLEDTIRIISGYSDIIVLRHNEEGSAKTASEISNSSIVNAGDGKGQHPTQTVLDLYTIYKEIGRVDNIKIAMVGDLASGRTIRSLCYLLGKFDGIEIIFVSPDNLQIGQDIKEYLQKHNIDFREEKNLNEILPKVDVIYMTRIQKERISEEEYRKANGQFKIDEDNLKLVRQNAIIMHPLPHVEEINLSVETEQKDKRVAYFRQAENGLYARMAILEFLLLEGF